MKWIATVIKSEFLSFNILFDFLFSFKNNKIKQQIQNKTQLSLISKANMYPLESKNRYEHSNLFMHKSQQTPYWQQSAKPCWLTDYPLISFWWRRGPWVSWWSSYMWETVWCWREGGRARRPHVLPALELCFCMPVSLSVPSAMEGNQNNKFYFSPCHTVVWNIFFLIKKDYINSLIQN